jgi:hypothetical protein
MPLQEDDMIAEKLERPVGICRRCRAVVRSFDEIGKKCARPLPYAAKCPGVIRSALAKDEWSECPLCHATGRADDINCARCNGAGWIFVGR